MNSASIHLLTSIIEAYDGIGTVTTLDRRLARVRICTPSGFEDLVRKIVEAERARLGIRSVRPSEAGAP